MSVQMRILHRALRLLSDYLMLPMFRLLGGTRDTVLGGRLCVLYTVGRRSGLPREIPLNYARASDGVVLLAGFGRNSAWYHNLLAAPRTSVRVGSSLHSATAAEITDATATVRVTRAVLKDAGAMGFFYGWDPRRASDEQVRAVVAETRCFHLRFDEPPPWSTR